MCFQDFINVTTDPTNIVTINTEEKNWSKKLSSQKQDDFVPIIQWRCDGYEKLVLYYLPVVVILEHFDVIKNKYDVLC